MSAPNGTSDTLKLQVGEVHVIALSQAYGRPVQSRFTGDQLMYTLADGRKLYTEPYFQERLKAAGIEVGVPFEIAKVEQISGNRRSVSIACRKLERTVPTAFEPAPPAFTNTEKRNVVPPSMPQAAPAPQSLPVLPTGPVNGQGEDGAAIMLRCYHQAIDVALAAVQYAESQGLRITPAYEDVRAMAATLCIQAGGRR